MFEAIMALNAVWCTMAFVTFSLRHREFAKVVVRRADRSSPLFETVASVGRFLGGMNAAFALLAVLLVVFSHEFPTSNQRVILLLAFAAAHFSQLYFNIPIARQNKRSGDGIWPVMRGPMKFIYITDLVMTMLNLLVVAYVVV